jgi:hypothetical protein
MTSHRPPAFPRLATGAGEAMLSPPGGILIPCHPMMQKPISLAFSALAPHRTR